MAPKRNDLPTVMMDDHPSQACLSYGYKENILGQGGYVMKYANASSLFFKNNIHSMFQLKHNKVSCCKKKTPDEVETMNII